MSTAEAPVFTEDLMTTRTILFQFTGQVDLELLAQTLPLVPMVFDKAWRRGTKPKVTQFPPYGCIYSVRYANVCRGVWGPPFKNSVMVDISLGNQSVNVKISKKSIHICGIRAKPMGHKLSQLLLDYAARAHTQLQAFSALTPDVQAQLLAAVLEGTRGATTTFPKYVVRKVQYKEKFKARRFEEGTETVLACKPLDAAATAGHVGVNTDIVVWISEMLRELRRHEDVAAWLEWLRGAAGRRLFGGDALVLDPEPHNVMINCSYSLGFPIKKDILKQIIDQRDDFVAHYDNTIDYYVNVELVYDDDELVNQRVLVSKKKRLAVHTFIVYDSGHVMQSSKFFESMKTAFYRFRALIDEVRPQIEDTTGVKVKVTRAPKN